MTCNTTTMVWNSPLKLSVNNQSDNKQGDFLLDDNGHCHFVYSSGEESHEKIIYRKIWNNLTLSDVEEISDGSQRCYYPSIIIDENDELNIFWNNHSVPDPVEFRGTKFIFSSIKENGNWSHPFEVGPYIPPERPSSGESDAFNSAACLDPTTNKVWLAYEIAEDYAYHTGIDIRARTSDTWEPSSQLTLVNNLAKDPQLFVTTNGDLICFWIDGRSVLNQVYFRVLFANGAWSEEIVLTAFTPGDYASLWNYVLIALGAALLLAVPPLIMRYVHRKREKKYIKEKLRQMD